MGNNGSSNKIVADREPICVNCDKKTQKALPEIDIQKKSGSNTNSDKNVNPSPSSAGSGQPCEESYGKVTVCMESNEGQITKCRVEWDAFKQCHQDHRR